MKKYLPSMMDLVKGFIVVLVSLFVLRFIPVGIKSKILGAPAA